MLLKLLIKLFLKLVFFGRTAYELSTQEFQSKANVVKERLNQAERQSEEAYHTVKSRFDSIENDLTDRVDTFQKKVMGVCAEGNVEVNDLRAELAELRAELRDLRRQSAHARNGNGHSQE